MKNDALLNLVAEAAGRLDLHDDGKSPLAAIPGMQKSGSQVSAGNGRTYLVRYDVPESAKSGMAFEAMSEAEATRYAEELGIPAPTLVGGFWQSYAMVTPAHALRWLQKFNIDNRDARETNTARMVRDIKAGRWRVTHQGIAFSAKPGRITRDGQHRLLAILTAAAELQEEGDTQGVAVPVLITLNLSKEAAMVIDGGTLRTVHDRSVLSGGSAIQQRWVPWIKRARIGLADAAAYSDDELVAWGQQHIGALRAIDEAIGRGVARVTVGPVVGAILRAYILEGPGPKRDRLMQFVKVLVTGENSAASNQAATQLRDRLLGTTGRRSKRITGRETYTLTQQALVAFAGKDPLPAGRIPREELFPTGRKGFEEAPANPEPTAASSS